MEGLGAVRIRSDIERKRLHHLPASARSGSDVGAGLYTEATTRATYAQLASLARVVVETGISVVVDAAFLNRWQRDLFRALARELGTPFLIVSCHTPQAVLRERVAMRERTAADASEATLAVLDHQLRTAEPLKQRRSKPLYASIRWTRICTTSWKGRGSACEHRSQNKMPPDRAGLNEPAIPAFVGADRGSVNPSPSGEGRSPRIDTSAAHDS